MESLEEVRAFFSKDQFASDMGAIVEAYGEHYAKCSVLLDARHKNAVGGVMGGVYFTLADFTFAVATNCMNEVVVSLDANISYLGAVRGEKLIGEAFCIKDGRTTNYYRIELKDELGNLAAIVNMTGFKKTRG